MTKTRRAGLGEMPLDDTVGITIGPDYGTSGSCVSPRLNAIGLSFVRASTTAIFKDKSEWPTECLEYSVNRLVFALMNGRRKVGRIDLNTI
jgi:hypothetical protein